MEPQHAVQLNPQQAVQMGPQQNIQLDPQQAVQLDPQLDPQLSINLDLNQLIDILDAIPIQIKHTYIHLYSASQLNSCGQLSYSAIYRATQHLS